MGYNFTSVFNEWNGQDGVKDPIIIPWCAERAAVWVHADDSAKKDHAKLILANQIRTIWVYRKDGKMAGADQLRALSYVLQDIMQKFRQHPNRRHYKVIVHGLPPRTAIRVEEYQVRVPKN